VEVPPVLVVVVVPPDDAPARLVPGPTGVPGLLPGFGPTVVMVVVLVEVRVIVEELKVRSQTRSDTKSCSYEKSDTQKSKYKGMEPKLVFYSSSNFKSSITQKLKISVC
jgi:hypothetical protein